MKVTIEVNGDTLVIPNAKVERFIDLQIGIPVSKVKVSYEGSAFEKLSIAFVEETAVNFSSEKLKTIVQVSGMTISENEVEYIFKEISSQVPCFYKILSFEHKFANEKAMLVPQDVRDLPERQTNILRELPYIRLILREDVPKGYLIPFPRYPESLNCNV